MTENGEKLEEIRRHIAEYPDFPTKNVLFRDIFSVLKKPRVFRLLCDVLLEHAKNIEQPVDAVVGLDSRGFLFGPLLALELTVPFYPVRKKGKLPGKTKSVAYELEYGQDVFEMQEGTVKPGERVVIVDDLIATGGSLLAACRLVEMCGANVVECLVVMELSEMRGRDKLMNPFHALIRY